MELDLKTATYILRKCTYSNYLFIAQLQQQVTIAAAAYESLPPIQKHVPIVHLNTLLDKPVINQQYCI